MVRLRARITVDAVRRGVHDVAPQLKGGNFEQGKHCRWKVVEIVLEGAPPVTGGKGNLFTATASMALTPGTLAVGLSGLVHFLGLTIR